MATITFLGGEETGNPAFCQWGRFKFIYGQPVECDDPHIVQKAKANRFFRVGGTDKVTVEVPVSFTTQDPLDHDGDGKKGGSLPKAKRGRPPKADTA